MPKPQMERKKNAEALCGKSLLKKGWGVCWEVQKRKKNGNFDYEERIAWNEVG